MVLAIAVGRGGIHRSYAKMISNGESVEMEAFFDTHIDPLARIKTDGWTGYTPLKKCYPNLIQVKSDQGEDFLLIHRQVMAIKAWLRGIHHHCKHLQAYLNEFNYRFNHRGEKNIFHNLITQMMNHPLTTYQKIKCV